MSECEEIAETFTAPAGSSLDDCRKIIRAAMPDEYLRLERRAVRARALPSSRPAPSVPPANAQSKLQAKSKRSRPREQPKIACATLSGSGPYNFASTSSIAGEVSEW